MLTNLNLKLAKALISDAEASMFVARCKQVAGDNMGSVQKLDEAFTSVEAASQLLLQTVENLVKKYEQLAQEAKDVSYHDCNT